MDSLDYYKIPAIAQTYPRPRVPMLPVLQMNGLSLGIQKQSIFCHSNAVRLSSGRVAILHALKCIGVSEADTVLVPAYHCMSMIEPVLWLGARVKFYNVDVNLRPLLDQQLTHNQVKPKAVIIPHFFGFLQEMAPICRYFEQLGIAVIEDCAHAFFGERAGKQAGDSGDYSITSSVKFFPGTEGGVLYSREHRIPDLHLAKRTAYQQLKAAKNIVENVRFKQAEAQTAATPPTPTLVGQTDSLELCQLSKTKLNYLDPQKILLPMSLADSMVLNHTDHQWLAQQRQSNYRYLAGLLQGLKNATLIFPELPVGTVPYVLPLLIHRPALHFPRLKMAGVPLWRWEELLVNDCPVSNDYRLKLIQLPIHQALSLSELEWIAQQLRQILASDH